MRPLNEAHRSFARIVELHVTCHVPLLLAQNLGERWRQAATAAAAATFHPRTSNYDLSIKALSKVRLRQERCHHVWMAKIACCFERCSIVVVTNVQPSAGANQHDGSFLKSLNACLVQRGLLVRLGYIIHIGTERDQSFRSRTVASVAGIVQRRPGRLGHFVVRFV